MDALSQRCASKRPVHLCLVTPRNLEERPGGTDPGGLLDRGVGFAGEGRTRVGGAAVESERDPGGGTDVSVLRLRLRSFAAPMDARMESVLSSPSARDAAAVLARCAGVARKSQPPPAL